MKVIRKIGGAQLLCELGAPGSPCELIAPITPHIPITPGWTKVYSQLAAQPLPENPTLSMSCLARHGQWGNTVLQYAFLRAFAKTHGFDVATPNWIGRRIFELADTDITTRFPVIVADACSAIHHIANHPLNSLWPRPHRAARVHRDGQRYYLLHDPRMRDARCSWPFTHADLEGLFTVHTRDLAAHRDFIHKLFRLRADIRARIEQTVAKVRDSHSTLVGIHVRRGDFVTSNLQQNFELLTPLADYVQWLDSIWPSLRQPVLIVATDSPSTVLPAFERFKPQSAASFGLHVEDLVPRGERGDACHQLGVVPSAEFLPDWSLLTQCDLLAISNSTFSFSASLMNQRAQQFVRPTFNGSNLVNFDPWDSEPLLMLQPSRTIFGELRTRVAITARALGPASIPRSLVVAALTYGMSLYRRLKTCRHLFGRTALLWELTRPEFYLDAGRRYHPAPKLHQPDH